MTPTKIVIQHRHAPGDTLVLTAAVRDLARAHPGRFELYADTGALDLWANNPYVAVDRKFLRGHTTIPATVVRADYGKAAHRGRQSERIHFLAGFHDDLGQKLGVTIPHGDPEPDLYLDELEETPYPDLPPRYWVLSAGGKLDFPVKIGPTATYQKVADFLRERGIPCVQAGVTHADGGVAHWQPTLAGTIDYRDRTDLRGLIRLVRHADGVVTGISFPMHLAAALGKPCVVLAGSREAWHWEAYDRRNPGLPHADRLRASHRYLHAMGLLSCPGNDFGGCWVNHVLGGPGQRVCHLPEEVADQWVARCLAMIRPETVIGSILAYYGDGTLPPVPGADLSLLFNLGAAPCAMTRFLRSPTP